MDNPKSNTKIEAEVKESIEYEPVIRINNYSSYCRIKDNGWSQKARAISRKDSGKVRFWAFTMIGYVKRSHLGIHYTVSKENIQGNLDVFCYKVSRCCISKKLFHRFW